MEEAYFDERDEKRKWKKKAKKRSCLIFMLLSIFVITLAIIMIFQRNVDENLFCEQKVMAHFPEYDFTDIYYYTDANTESYCVATYTQRSGMQRDGLREVQHPEERTLELELVNQEDKDHQKSDDLTNMVAGILIFLSTLWLCAKFGELLNI